MSSATYMSHTALNIHIYKMYTADQRIFCHTALHLQANMHIYTVRKPSSATAVFLVLTDFLNLLRPNAKWIQRGLCVLAARDIPTVWLPMCANPGKLPASLAKPPLVSSWWMVVVFITPPVVTTGTACSRVLLLVPAELRTWSCGLPQIAFR